MDREKEISMVGSYSKQVWGIDYVAELQAERDAMAAGYRSALEREGKALKALDDLTNSIICLCAEGPEVMRAAEIYEACIKDAQKAREAIAR